MIAATYTTWSESLDCSIDRSSTFSNRKELRDYLAQTFGKQWEIRVEQLILIKKAPKWMFWKKFTTVTKSLGE